MTSFQLCNFWLLFFIFALIEGLRPLQKNRIRQVLSKLLLSNFNGIDWRYLRQAVKSCIFSSWHWVIFLTFFQVLSTKTRKSLRFLHRKALNCFYISSSGLKANKQCLYCNHYYGILFCNNKVAKKSWLELIAWAVTKCFSHYWQKLQYSIFEFPKYSLGKRALRNCF